MSNDPTYHEPKKRWRDLQQGGDAPTSKKARNMFLLAAILLALMGVIAALLIVPGTSTSPMLVTLPIREYNASAWPTNPFAVQDSEALLKHFDKHKSAFNSQTRFRILKELHELPQQPKQPLIVYLTALARSKNDQVYLLPGDAQPDSVDRWLSLHAVLEPLKKHPSWTKLLILDLMHPLADPKLGVLHDDVADKVHAHLQKLTENKDLPISVLCACSPGQLSLTSEEIKQSVLVHYLQRGLQGYADGHGPKGRIDDQISVQELAAYVHKYVDLWARGNRDARQQPVLCGHGRNFILTSATAPRTQEVHVNFDKESYPIWLRAGWELRDRWYSGQFYLLAPRAYKQVEVALLRAEERWRHGIEAKRLQKELARDLQLNYEEVLRAQQMPMMAPNSLALAVMTGPSTPAKKEEKKQDDKAKSPPKKSVNPGNVFRALLTELQTGKLKDKDVPKAAAKYWQDVEGVWYPNAAQAIFNTLVSSPKPSAAQVLLARQILAQRNSKPLFVETLMLQRLQKLADKIHDKGWPWSDLAASQLLRTTREAEQAAAQLQKHPHTLAWVKDLLNTADGNRRQGEKILFTERFPAWPNASAFLSEAEQQYRNLQGHITTITQANHDYLDALIFLPGHASYLGTLTKDDTEERDIWANAIDSTLALAKLLEKPHLKKIEAVSHARIQLKDQLNQLRNAFAARVREHQRIEHFTGKTYRQLQGLLTSPQLTAGERLHLWRDARALSQRLHRETLAAEQKKQLARLAPRVSQTAVSERTEARTALRAWLSLRLLKLAGSDVSELQKLWQKARQSQEASKWEPVAEVLHAQWARQLPRRFLNSEKDLATAERLSCLLYTADVQQEEQIEKQHWSHNPTAHQNRQQCDMYWSWLGQRFREEHKSLSAWAPEITFFARTAEAYGQ